MCQKTGGMSNQIPARTAYIGPPNRACEINDIPDPRLDTATDLPQDGRLGLGIVIIKIVLVPSEGIARGRHEPDLMPQSIIPFQAAIPILKQLSSGLH